LPVAPSHSVPIDGWRYKKVAQSNDEKAAEDAVAFDDSSWDPIDIRTDVGAIGLHEKAFYRTRFTVGAKDLASPAVELVFSKISGGVAVYVNGHKVGGGMDGRSAAIYDVKALLHPGENVIAVPIENYGTDGAGLSKGVFNGLAEVIVQSTGETGTLTLKASSDGLQPASLQVKAMPAMARPSLP
jgi:beta-galactosidase